VHYANRIIEPRRYVESVRHYYEFDSIATPGFGYAFDCTPGGVIVVATPTQAESLRIARAEVAAGRMREVGHGSYRSGYWEAASMRCDCGSNVYLDDAMANECADCGAFYNGSAQRLADPRTWEPEDRYAVFGPQNQPED
jgi:hypothetical protein